MEEKYFNLIFIIIFIVINLFGIMHFIFYFFFKITEFDDIYESLDSYPLFNFRIDEMNCSSNKMEEYIIFHELQGIEETATDGGTKSQNQILKINGNYFCYEKQKSYKELLYNGQIIKQNENCKFGYKNCGIIDTLKQKLCILIEDDCPLYDVGINDDNKNYESDPNYIYDSSSKIYYNSNNYEDENKKIIGNLILNEGEPCYNPKEKLWRAFGTKETRENHLKCKLEIFGKNSDNRYDKKGDITYYDLYKDNFNYQFFSLLDKNELKKEKVSLYKREFLGIDKNCDEKSDLTEERYKKLKKHQKSEKILLLVEPIIIFVFNIIFIFIFIFLHGSDIMNNLICCDFLYLIFFIPFMICQSVFISAIIENNLFYECSDDLTNELLNHENKNTKKTIIYGAINLAADCLIIIPLLFLAIKIICEDGSTICAEKKSKPIKEPKINPDPEKKNNIAIQNDLDTNKENITIAKDEEPQYNKDQNSIISNKIYGSKFGEKNLGKNNPTSKEEIQNSNSIS